MTNSARATLQGLDDTRALAEHLAGVLQPGDLMILTGDLGAGKTTFTQYLGRALGIDSPVTSPTFVLSRHHQNPGEGPDLVHVDAYRMSSTDELSSLDLESSMPDSITVIEWGRELAEELGARTGWLDIEFTRQSLPAETSEPVFDFSEEVVEEDRSVTLEAHGQRFDGENLLPPGLREEE